ncbi:protein DpdJ [Catenulispora pinisilvae]|uniref:protein DpdJ n=1 Tax=Catenulispora pinisilvae TaxID=2705253 RepID=UPI002B2728D8|nr:protein DpdJ [Catenulispora pinisilvae]
MTEWFGREWTSALLDALEDLELPLLSWGVTGGALSMEEVLEVIDEQCSGRDDSDSAPSPEALLGHLLDKALLFRVPESVPERYRTRLAESLFLTAHLRQLFPPNWTQQPNPGWWQNGRRLVADYRLHVAPRRYPKRDVDGSAALTQLRQLAGWGSLQSAVAEAYLKDFNLARFQVNAAISIFTSMQAQQGRGVIVGAGTGSGKTLAFYLPAYAAMAENAIAGRNQLHTLALYPRKELLRDQMRTAVSAALEVAPAMCDRPRGRVLRIGALYGDTPWDAADRKLTGERGVKGAWRRTGHGAVCPYFPCPRCGTGDLVWSDADRAQKVERLQCACGLVLDDGMVVLTRLSLQNRAPDLLFTTTEMLNLNASNPGLGKLLGWQGGRPPELVLLDEVHTYTGVHGAQVALLLRRWRNDVRKPVTFVGLSATLRDAAQFFADLVGLPEQAVDYIEPAPEAMEEQGREYAIALRGDPVSGASLLSTSIQVAMLHGRLMDLGSEPFLYGSVGFIFTDDLDVTNRFYNDLRDAEGRQLRSGASGRGRVLAALRSPAAPFWRDRYQDGQSWDIVEMIGRKLHPDASGDDLHIGRTSSQDVGVESAADLIVATASLEVGFNDPRVGTVFQHKAPYDTAAFIQRRGRAGRTREMRPTTVVVLSDYGRDRLAYQGYESLFLPELAASRLPVTNRFVLKIQGAQAMLDWLGTHLRRRDRYVDPRELLKAPRNGVDAGQEARRQALADLLERLLKDPILQAELADHLRRALRISVEEAQAILWEQPRSLLLSVVPTAWRRMRANWEVVRPDANVQPGRLLPEYLTPSLFAPLNVPEAYLRMPATFAMDPDVMPIAKALREAVPGRVSRRFGYRRDEHRTWLADPRTNGGTLPLESMVHGNREGLWEPHDGNPVEVVRPTQIQLQEPPTDIASHSQSVPAWATQILPPLSDLSSAALPDASPWTRNIVTVAFGSHAAGNAIDVRRMTTGASCQLNFEGGRTPSVDIDVTYTIDGDTPAALGFALGVDCMRLQVGRLDLGDPAVAEHLRSPAWRTLAFMTAVAEDPALDRVANTFQRTWLSLVYLTTFALDSFDGNLTPDQIRTSLASGSWRNGLAQVLQVLYRDSSTTPTTSTDRLTTALTALSQNPDVIDCLNRCSQLLTAPDVAARTTDLAQRVYRDTMAAGVLAAALRACPQAQDGDLILDIVPRASADEPATIWLSETAIGGLGVIEHLTRYYAEDPRRFWGLVETALGPGDYEYVDGTLTRLLAHLAAEPGGEATRAMTSLRTQGSASAAIDALSHLRAAWARVDGPPRHTAVAALSTRLLRPGSTAATDAAALAIVEQWNDLEQRLGFEIDAPIVAYAVGCGRLALSGGASLTADQAFSILWPRGQHARNQHLSHYQPYAARPVLDRLLVSAAHEQRFPTVDVTDPAWLEQYRAILTTDGAAELTAPAANAAELAAAVAAVPVIVIERDVLHVYGEVRGFTRRGDQVCVRVEIREAVQ